MERNQVYLIGAIKRFLKDRFDLRSDQAHYQITIDEITKGVEFRGTNLWILIFAIFIASIGLNVNSTAVIIGAMLISPLMGPIMGIGLGAGINDLSLIKKAVRNLAVAAGMSVVTSALYFFLTPLHEAQSELLARTYPTLWDVLIALFGGLAGIVAASRSQKSNAIPGVAIATALMPPLCTAGYGLANGNWYYFLGALFLFLINGVFISLSTFMFVRFLKYPRTTFENARMGKNVRLTISFLVFITVVPSGYLAYNLVRETIFQEKARVFIKNEFNFAQTQVISKEIIFTPDSRNIAVTLYGKQLTTDEIQNIKLKLDVYKLSNTELIVNQGFREDNTSELEAMSQKMRTQVFEDLYVKNEAIIESKDEKIRLLENELLKFRQASSQTGDISAELKIQYPELKSLAISNTPIFNLEENRLDTTCLVLAIFSKRPSNKELGKIQEWLKVRTKMDNIQFIVQ